jgi:hypothetical protein
MRGTVDNCTLTSDNYNYNEMIHELKNKYAFDIIGEGGFGVVLGTKSCAIKIIKDLNRCDELKKEKLIYETIEKHPNNMMGRIPKYNLYNELSTFCQFNIEKIESPLSEYDESEYKTRVGYVIGEENNQYIFRDMKLKNGVYLVDKDKIQIKPYRRIIHFYVNHYDVNFKEQSEQRGTLYGLNQLILAFTEEKIQDFCFAMGELISYFILDCSIYPFDIECAIGTNNDRICTLYIYDFNECEFIDGKTDVNVVAMIAAKSLYNKDGKFMYPNYKHKYYSDFVDGLKNNRDDSENEFINKMLAYYNQSF